jgi:hypothetical protein
MMIKNQIFKFRETCPASSESVILLVTQRRTANIDLKSNIQVLRTRRASRKSESDSGAGGQKKQGFCCAWQHNQIF